MYQVSESAKTKLATLLCSLGVSFLLTSNAVLAMGGTASVTSQDGSTILHYAITGEGPENSRISALEFCGSDGKMRATVKPDYVASDYHMSADGYVALLGRKVDSALFLSMYDPYGKFLWESPIDGHVDYTVITQKSRRTVMICRDRLDWKDPEWFLLTLNDRGAQLKRSKLTGLVSGDPLAAGNLVLVVMESGIHAYAAEDMSEKWLSRFTKSDYVTAAAASPDMKHLAVVHPVEYKDGNTNTLWRVTYLDAATGNVLRSKDVALEGASGGASIRYDDKERCFIVERGVKAVAKDNKRFKVRFDCAR